MANRTVMTDSPETVETLELNQRELVEIVKALRSRSRRLDTQLLDDEVSEGHETSIIKSLAAVGDILQKLTGSRA